MRYEHAGYGPDAVDCYGLVYLAFLEVLGIELPRFEYPEDAEPGARVTFEVGFAAFDGLFDKVRPPLQPFDVIYSPGVRRDHLYLVVDDAWALHAEPKVDVHRVPWRVILFEKRRNASCLRYRSRSA